MEQKTICLVLVGFLFTGYLVLAGFDYGVGMLLPFIGRSDAERQAIIQTMAPVWEGNQVWLIVAGAVLFAGFPDAYATLLSGLYLPLLLILAALVIRGVAFEFRNKDKIRIWRNFWDWTLFTGSIIPALLWGVAIGCLLTGLPIDGEKQYTGTLKDLFSAYTIITGVLFMLLFLLHGATYLASKLDRRMTGRIKPVGMKLCRVTLGVALLFSLFTYNMAGSGAKIITGVSLLLAVAAIYSVDQKLDDRHPIIKFIFSGLAIAATAAAVFAALFPRIVVSSLNPEWSLDVNNSASNPLALQSLTFAMIIVLPVVLAFEGWKYYIFRARIIIPAAGLASRRLLWEELRARLMELTGCSCKLVATLKKATHSLANQEMEPKVAPRLHAFSPVPALKTSMLRGRKLVTVKPKTKE